MLYKGYSLSVDEPDSHGPPRPGNVGEETRWGTCRVPDPATLFEVMPSYLEAVEVEVHGAEANC